MENLTRLCPRTSHTDKRQKTVEKSAQSTGILGLWAVGQRAYVSVLFLSWLHALLAAFCILSRPFDSAMHCGTLWMPRLRAKIATSESKAGAITGIAKENG